MKPPQETCDICGRPLPCARQACRAARLHWAREATQKGTGSQARPSGGDAA